ncbi:FadR family transcriptional regulator [Rhodococcus sp. HNM0563]|uniref:FadR/GntR family transcriptional regulator n=1 Tax=unclassified Rhodococcus (in: high G+C Gram-positive bacteria) TaxID=192944 RepID=UPI00146BED75|nr:MULTISPECIES: GntR family transcriptional regulator [unclassified Rhodococcus (in: high G+C Gram-positive bacteria)]MCK0091350.1 GntR family transcriptional regulator [Rhodococcus sp. F64268]NLU63782.1 FadR family transcriptional regulator [Rhodococcus sp. HNM0563]
MPLDARSAVVRVPKAGELIAASLRRQIITGELEAGEPLPNEAALMERFGVSRPTLREAFRILESEGIITVLRGARGGARVQAPDGSTAARYTGLILQYRGVPLADVYRARTELEVAAVGLIAADPGDRIDALAEVVERGDTLVDDPHAFVKYASDVNRTIMELGGNQTMSTLASMLLDIMDAHNALFLSTRTERDSPGTAVALRANHKLVELLRAGEPGAAEAFWRRHLDSVERYMTGDSETTLVEVLS